MSEKAEIIKQEHIKKLLVFLTNAYKATKDGYSRVSMSDIARASELSEVSGSLQAAKNLGFLKHTGVTRHVMWYWSRGSAGAPDQSMAERMYTEIRRIKTNKGISKDLRDGAKAKGLVKVVKPSVAKVASDKKNTTDGDLVRSNMTNNTYILSVLMELYKNAGDLINIVAMTKRYNIDAKAFFDTLIDIDVIKRHDRILNMYKWQYESPTGVMADFIVDAYFKNNKIELKNSTSAATFRSKQKEERSQRALLVLREVYSAKNGYTDSMSTLIRKNKLQTSYLTEAIRLGILINSGTKYSPSYTMKSEPTLEMVYEIEKTAVSMYADTKKKSVEKGKDKNTVSAVTTSSAPVDLISMYDRATKRKKYLEEELAKVNKILDAVNTVNNLGALLNADLA